MSFDIYQAVTDKIIALLEKGVAPWRKPWSTGNAGAPRNLVSDKPYSGINYFLLGCQEYESPYWLTFKQALDQGGHVRKGEKGSLCIFWKIYEKADDKAESGVKRLPVLRHYTVFNARQCDGLDYPEVEIQTWPEHKRIEKAEEIQFGMPDRPTVHYGGGRAFYSPSEDLVMVPELQRFEKPQEFYSVLFHELAHSTGHMKRLNREGITKPHAFGDPIYSREELIAEMAASFLCAQCGIETATLENSAAYLQGWVKALRGDKKLVVTAAANAQKAADYILNAEPRV